MRSRLTLTVAALALTACAKSGSQPASANVATAPAGVAANAAAATYAPAPSNASSSPAASVPPAQPGLPQSSADASASTVTVQFQRGSHCWKYDGVASTFNGSFAAGQQVDITSTGLQANGDGSAGWYETRPRNVEISGADGKLLIANSSGYFTIPASGAYQITFDPMSMVGAPGEMIVCTL
jgi:hypothetical protein